MKRAFLLLFLFSPAAFAGEPPPDVGPLLMDAQKAWTDGDALSAQMTDALKRGLKDYEAVVEKQQAAYERANKLFREALAKDPAHPQALADHGRFWISRREFGLARSRLESAWLSGEWPANNPKDLVAPCGPCGARAIRAFSNSEKADILRTLGGLTERAGELNYAIAYYKLAMQFDPLDPRNRISQAVALCAIGNHKDAAALLEPWANATGADYPQKKDDKLALGLYTLGLAKEELGYFDQALKLYSQAHELAVKSGLTGRGTLAELADLSICRLEDAAEALEAREKERQAENAKRTKENEKRAQKLPLIPDERELFGEASHLCDRGVEFKKRALNDPAFRVAMEHARANDGDDRVREINQNDDFMAAVQSFSDAISKSPKLWRAHYELALCNLMAGKFNTAQTLLQAAALYSPNSVAVLNLYGEVLLELGQWEKAAEIFARLASLDPDFGRAHFGRARALAALQTDATTCSEALDEIERAIQLGVRDERIHQIRVLVTKDGDEYRGTIIRDNSDYLVHGSAGVTNRFAESEVAEVRTEPGLRKQIVEVLERFKRGEKLPPRPVISRKNRAR